MPLLRCGPSCPRGCFCKPFCRLRKKWEEFGETHWGPRIIDLDILLFGQEVVQEDDLIIPHPELHKRRFVLVPLNELASYAIHPTFGVSVRGLLQRLQDDSRVERIV